MKKSDRKVRDFFSFLIANRGTISMGKSFLLAVCVNKWKEWMIVCFGFQFLESAVFVPFIPGGL